MEEGGGGWWKKHSKVAVAFAGGVLVAVSGVAAAYLYYNTYNPDVTEVEDEENHDQDRRERQLQRQAGKTAPHFPHVLRLPSSPTPPSSSSSSSSSTSDDALNTVQPIPYEFAKHLALDFPIKTLRRVLGEAGPRGLEYEGLAERLERLATQLLGRQGGRVAAVLEEATLFLENEVGLPLPAKPASLGPIGALCYLLSVTCLVSHLARSGGLESAFLRSRPGWSLDDIHCHGSAEAKVRRAAALIGWTEEAVWTRALHPAGADGVSALATVASNTHCLFAAKAIVWGGPSDPAALEKSHSGGGKEGPPPHQEARPSEAQDSASSSASLPSRPRRDADGGGSSATTDAATSAASVASTVSLSATTAVSVGGRASTPAPAPAPAPASTPAPAPTPGPASASASRSEEGTQSEPALSLVGSTASATSVALQSIPSLCMFSLLESYYSLDGFVFHMSGSQGSSPEALSRALRAIFRVLCSFDPSGSDVGPLPTGRRWQFAWSLKSYFVTTFGPAYVAASSRYSFGSPDTFVLFQPNDSFGRHHITANEGEGSIRHAIRTRFDEAGRSYENDTSLPVYHEYVRPVSGHGPNFPWWMEDSNE